MHDLYIVSVMFLLFFVEFRIFENVIHGNCDDFENRKDNNVIFPNRWQLCFSIFC